MKRADIHVAAAAGLSVYLPLYWMATTLTDACGNPEPLTAFKVVVLLLVLASYLSAPLLLSLPSRYTLVAGIPLWLAISAVGSAILVLVGVAGIVFIKREPIIVEAPFIAWGILTVWTMPASAAVYYFGAVVRWLKGWHRGPDYDALGFRK
ncbi:MAG TPA: hypothetical protein VFZ44_07005, partial [Pyrinomonadaceae bacterium]